MSLLSCLSRPMRFSSCTEKELLSSISKERAVSRSDWWRVLLTATSFGSSTRNRRQKKDAMASTGVAFGDFVFPSWHAYPSAHLNFSSASVSVVYLCVLGWNKTFRTFPIRYAILLPVHLLGSDLFNRVWKDRGLKSNQNCFLLKWNIRIRDNRSQNVVQRPFLVISSLQVEIFAAGSRMGK